MIYLDRDAVSAEEWHDAALANAAEVQAIKDAHANLSGEDLWAAITAAADLVETTRGEWLRLRRLLRSERGETRYPAAIRGETRAVADARHAYIEAHDTLNAITAVWAARIPAGVLWTA